MKGTSIFTERLQALTRISAKIDRATIKDADLITLQRISAAIDRDYTTGYYGLSQRQTLRSTAAYLIDAAREGIRLNEYVKQASREIEKARRAERRNAEKEDKTA